MKWEAIEVEEKSVKIEEIWWIFTGSVPLQALRPIHPKSRNFEKLLCTQTYRSPRLRKIF